MGGFDEEQMDVVGARGAGTLVDEAAASLGYEDGESRMKWWGIFIAFLWLFVIATSASAAVTPNSIVTAQTPKAYKAQITNASGTGAVALVAGQANGTKVVSIICSNTDTNPYNVTFSVLRSATTYVLATVTIPASAGNVAGTLPINIFSGTNLPGVPLDAESNPYLLLESSDTLQMASGTVVTSGKVISCHTVAADF